MQRPLLLVTALPILVAGLVLAWCPHVQCKTVYVAQRTTPDGPRQENLVEALKDPNVTTIVLLTDISSESLAALGPIQLDRNLTITSKDPSYMQVWDMQNRWGVVNICNTCVLTFKSVVLANDRQETGPNVGFVTGDAPSNSSWGLVRIINAARQRYGCVPSAISLTFVQRTGSPRFPEVQQSASVQDYDFRGTLFKDTLRIATSSAQVDRVWVQGRNAFTGGYDLEFFNYTRLCGAYADPTCLQQSTEDVCIAQLNAAAATVGQQQQHAVHPVAIALPVVLGVLVLLAALGLWWRRRRRLQRSQIYGGVKGGVGKGDVTPFAPAGGSCQPNVMDEELGSKPVPSGSMPSHPGAAPAHATGCSSNSAGSWQLLHAYSCSSASGVASGMSCPTQATTTMDGAAQVAAIELGPLLGAGSFGRVYRGTWRGQEVAVKVIDHLDGGELSDVCREAKLLLSMNHNNIVKAYSFLTCTWMGPVTLPDQQSGGRSTGTAATGSTPPSTAQPIDRNVRQQGPAAVGVADSNDGSISFSQGSALMPLTCSNSIHSPQLTTMERHDLTPGLSEAALAVSGGAGAAAALRAGSSPHPPSSLASTTVAAAAMPVKSSGSSSTAGQPFLMESAEARHSSGSSNGSSGSSGRNHHSPGRTVRTWIIMEFCDGGDLSSVLRTLRNVLEPTSQGFMVNLLSLLQGAAEGLAHLHARHIVHGDLNARNVLVCIQDTIVSQQAVAKVSDFGLSRSLTMSHRTTETQGTITHMSPERLTSGRMSPAADVFAFGVMMWEVWTGKSAFKGMHFGQVCQAVVMQDARPHVPADMPLDYRELMVHCWAREPFQRPTMTEVLHSLQQLLKTAGACSSGDTSLETVPAASVVASLSNTNLMLQQQQSSGSGVVQDGVQHWHDTKGRPSSEQQQQATPAVVDVGPGPAADDDGKGLPDEELGGTLQPGQTAGTNTAARIAARAAGAATATTTGSLSPVDKAAWAEFVRDL